MDISQTKRDLVRGSEIEDDAEDPSDDLVRLVRAVAAVSSADQDTVEFLLPPAVAAPSERDPDRIARGIALLRTQARPFGELLSEARSRTGLSRAEIAARTALPEVELGWWETGAGIVSVLRHGPANVGRLASELRIPRPLFALSFSHDLLASAHPLRTIRTEAPGKAPTGVGTRTTGVGVPLDEWLSAFLSEGAPPVS